MQEIENRKHLREFQRVKFDSEASVMRDEINSLKSSKKYKGDECFVMNTDDSSSSGTHWTAVNVTDGKTFYLT